MARNEVLSEQYHAERNTHSQDTTEVLKAGYTAIIQRRGDAITAKAAKTKKHS